MKLFKEGVIIPNLALKADAVAIKVSKEKDLMAKYILPIFVVKSFSFNFKIF